MTFVSALHDAFSVGVQVAVDGGDLVLEAAAAPPPAIVRALVVNKRAIIALLRPGADGWDAVDWQAFFNERAGVAQFDADLPRTAAEAAAVEECLQRWQSTHLPASLSHRACAACGSHLEPDAMIAFIAGQGSVQLHLGCMGKWAAMRRRDALLALRAFGVVVGAPGEHAP